MSNNRNAFFKLDDVSLDGSNRRPATVLDPTALAKYKDALPLPSVLKPVRKHKGADFYEVAMTQFRQQLHADLPPTLLWGYGDARQASGSFPGPTLEARAGKRILVKWINDIDAGGYLIPEAFDTFLDGTRNGEPRLKTVVHLHGGHVADHSDGNPAAWFTRGFGVKGPAWRTKVYEYPNKQEAATLWYHDHALGQTRLNVYAGLAGFYLLRSKKEEKLGLPAGKYEIPLAIQDRVLDIDGSLLYRIRDPLEVPTNQDHPGPWVPEFFGDLILVNGKVWPFLEVEPRKYRFRILNGSDARFYHLRLSSGQPFVQIAAEQGLFRAPVQLDSILVAPGERADVIVDFSGQSGEVFLTNDARTPFPSGAEVDPATTAHIMKFIVGPRALTEDAGAIPAILDDDDPGPAAGRHAPAVTRNMAIVEFTDANGASIIGLLNNRLMRSPITDKPELGAVEVWNIVNTTGDTHPIHLHLVKLQLLQRQKFDVAAYLGAWNPGPPGTGPAPVAPDLFLRGAPIAPDANETGFKDTVRANPGEVTTITMRFADYTGTYPWHCHILEHEDNEMMQQFEVVRKK